jgi:replicative DNA helicase
VSDFAPLAEEKHVIGCFLLPGGEVSAAIEHLTPEDFWLERHQVLFQTFATMWGMKEPIDSVTAATALRRAGNLQRAGGEAYLLEIMAEVVSDAGLPAYVKTVKEDSLRRKLIAGAQRILTMAKDETQANEQVLGESEAILHAIAEKRFAQGFQRFGRIIPEALDYLHKVSTGQITGCPTGLVDLDRVTGGLQPTDLIILAGRPGMGKTSLGVSIAWRAAKKGKRVGLFTLEMGKLQVVQRILCAWRNVNLFKLRTGHLSEEEGELFRHAVENLKSIPLEVDEGSRKTPLQVLSQARRLKHEGGLDLLMLDHLQLGKLDRPVENRAEMLEEFAYSMKATAKDLEIPVVCMAQLSRKGEVSKGEPNLSDLKGSGGIEEAADIVGFIHRPEVYEKDAEHGLAELIFGKYRNGPAGDAIKLRFNHDSASFSDYVAHQEPPRPSKNRQIGPEDL